MSWFTSAANLCTGILLVRFRDCSMIAGTNMAILLTLGLIGRLAIDSMIHIWITLDIFFVFLSKVRNFQLAFGFHPSRVIWFGLTVFYIPSRIASKSKHSLKASHKLYEVWRSIIVNGPQTSKDWNTANAVQGQGRNHPLCPTLLSCTHWIGNG